MMESLYYPALVIAPIDHFDLVSFLLYETH